MNIVGIDGLTREQVHREIASGGKFVTYQYTISLLVVTFKRFSDIFFIPAGRNAIVHGLPYTLVSLVLGWWGIPWGPIYTVQGLWINLTGGRDVTPEILAHGSVAT